MNGWVFTAFALLIAFLAFGSGWLARQTLVELDGDIAKLKGTWIYLIRKIDTGEWWNDAGDGWVDGWRGLRMATIYPESMQATLELAPGEEWVKFIERNLP